MEQLRYCRLNNDYDLYNFNHNYESSDTEYNLMVFRIII